MGTYVIGLAAIQLITSVMIVVLWYLLTQHCKHDTLQNGGLPHEVMNGGLPHEVMNGGLPHEVMNGGLPHEFMKCITPGHGDSLENDSKPDCVNNGPE